MEHLMKKLLLLPLLLFSLATGYGQQFNGRIFDLDSGRVQTFNGTIDQPQGMSFSEKMRLRREAFRAETDRIWAEMAAKRAEEQLILQTRQLREQTELLRKIANE